MEIEKCKEKDGNVAAAQGLRALDCTVYSPRDGNLKRKHHRGPASQSERNARPPHDRVSLELRAA
jgi:hypothetical protein